MKEEEHNSTITKYLVQIEFRYQRIPPSEIYSQHTDTMLTLGVYNDEQEAYNAGNEALEKLEAKYPIHVFPSGQEAPKERFSKNGGAFGSSKRLITNLAYLKTPFSFYAKVTPLFFDGLEEVVDMVHGSLKKYRKCKETLNNQ